MKKYILVCLIVSQTLGLSWTLEAEELAPSNVLTNSTRELIVHKGIGDKMKVFIVLAAHGVPPKDFPKHEMEEFFGLHQRLEHAKGADRELLEHRFAELDVKMRSWARTEQNDPYYASTQEIGKHLSKVTGYEVIVGFNEFCGPSVDGAINQAIVQGAEKIVVVTQMMTQGGVHSETDIPAAIKRSKEKHPDIPILYAWPFEIFEIAQFLATKIHRFVEK